MKAHHLGSHTLTTPIEFIVVPNCLSAQSDNREYSALRAAVTFTMSCHNFITNFLKISKSINMGTIVLCTVRNKTPRSSNNASVYDCHYTIIFLYCGFVEMPSPKYKLISDGFCFYK